MVLINQYNAGSYTVQSYLQSFQVQPPFLTFGLLLMSYHLHTTSCHWIMSCIKHIILRLLWQCLPSASSEVCLPGTKLPVIREYSGPSLSYTTTRNPHYHYKMQNTKCKIHNTKNTYIHDTPCCLDFPHWERGTLLQEGGLGKMLWSHLTTHVTYTLSYYAWYIVL